MQTRNIFYILSKRNIFYGDYMKNRYRSEKKIQISSKEWKFKKMKKIEHNLLL